MTKCIDCTHYKKLGEHHGACSKLTIVTGQNGNRQKLDLPVSSDFSCKYHEEVWNFTNIAFECKDNNGKRIIKLPDVLIKETANILKSMLDDEVFCTDVLVKRVAAKILGVSEVV